jgi:riboflavin-specific deaminase-like protein
MQPRAEGLDPRSLAHPHPIDISGFGDEELAALFSAETPWLRLVMVITEDGHTTGPSGSSRDISGPRDLEVMTLLRALSDAVMVGATTAVADSYCRIRVRASRQHLRRSQSPEPRLCVVTSSGNIPLDSAMFREQSRPIIITSALGAQRLIHADAEVIVAGDNSVDLPVALIALNDRGIHSISCEGGTSLARSLLHDGLVDEVDLTVSPTPTGRGPVFPTLEAPWHLETHAVDGEWSFLRFLR